MVAIAILVLVGVPVIGFAITAAATTVALHTPENERPSECSRRARS